MINVVPTWNNISVLVASDLVLVIEGSDCVEQGMTEGQGQWICPACLVTISEDPSFEKNVLVCRPSLLRWPTETFWCMGVLQIIRWPRQIFS